MEALIRDGEVTRGFIGIEQRDLTPDIAQTLNLPVKQGVLITGVVQSGPAAAGGLRPGDVVVSVGGTPVANTYQLLNAVASLRPKAVAAIGVQRGIRPSSWTSPSASAPRLDARCLERNRPSPRDLSIAIAIPCICGSTRWQSGKAFPTFTDKHQMTGFHPVATGTSNFTQLSSGRSRTSFPQQASALPRRHCNLAAGRSVAGAFRAVLSR